MDSVTDEIPPSPVSLPFLKGTTGIYHLTFISLKILFARDFFGLFPFSPWFITSLELDFHALS